MWGQGHDAGGGLIRHWIIPTRVGTSFCSARNNGRSEDHPHACGDKFEFRLDDRRTLGSSPRVWGQARRPALPRPQRGIIPTRVGTRSALRTRDRQVGDHPHACGDKTSRAAFPVGYSGSSPRVWGQAGITRTSLAPARIIPTRVGTRLKKSRKIAVLQNQPLRFPLTFHRSFV